MYKYTVTGNTRKNNEKEWIFGTIPEKRKYKKNDFHDLVFTCCCSTSKNIYVNHETLLHF